MCRNQYLWSGAHSLDFVLLNKTDPDDMLQAVHSYVQVLLLSFYATIPGGLSTYLLFVWSGKITSSRCRVILLGGMIVLPILLASSAIAILYSKRFSR